MMHREWCYFFYFLFKKKKVVDLFICLFVCFGDEEMIDTPFLKGHHSDLFSVFCFLAFLSFIGHADGTDST